MESLEPLMTSDEVASILHVDPVTIHRVINKGELAAYRIGSDYRLALSDLKDYLQRQRIPSKAEMTMSSDNPFDQFIQWIHMIWPEETVVPAEFVQQEQDRFDTFTRRARQVLILAQEEAKRLQQNFVDTDHLFLGLVGAGEGVATLVLKNLRVDLEQVRNAVEHLIGVPERIVLPKISLLSSAQKAIELAVEEARGMQHRYLGTQHLLLGVIRTEGADQGIVVDMLERLGVDLEQTRAETLRVLSKMKGKRLERYPPVELGLMDPLIADAEQQVTCRRCEVHNPGFLRTCFNCGDELVKEQPPKSA